MAEKRILVLENYHLDFFERLGKGAFGVVYKGVDVRTRTPVAVKELSVKKERIASMCLDEIKALQSVPVHDHVVQMRNFFFKRTAFWLVMEFCDLGDLEGYFKKHRPLMNTRIEFMTQIANGVAFMHGLERKMMHRDIKPQNVLVHYGEHRPICKLSDFGLAKIQEESAGTSLAKSFILTTQAGTVCFMAPEMFKGRQYGQVVDVFAMGLMFLGMVDFDKKKVLFPLAKGMLSASPIGQMMVTYASLGQPIPEVVEASADDTPTMTTLKAIVREMLTYEPTDRLKSPQALEKLNAVFDTVKQDLPPPPARPVLKLPPTLEEALKEEERGGGARSGRRHEDAGVGYRLLRDALAQLVGEDVEKKKEKMEGRERERHLNDMPLMAAVQQMQRRLFDGEKTRDKSRARTRGERREEQRGLARGTRVKVSADKAECQELQKGYGEWVDAMDKYLGVEGEVVEEVIHMVRVKLPDGNQFLFNPALLTPLDAEGRPAPPPTGRTPQGAEAQGAEAGAGPFRRYDIVRLPEDEATARTLQEAHGGWNDAMKLALGIKGIVSFISSTGDVKVTAINGHRWLWNPELLTKVPEDPNARLEGGDMVALVDDERRVEELQDGHGEWVPALRDVLGHVGVIRKVLDDRVQVEVDRRRFFFNPLACKLIAKSEDVIAAFFRKKFEE